MDSLSDGTENQSVAKRLKLEPNSQNAGVLCNKSSFSNNFTTTTSAIGEIKETTPEIVVEINSTPCTHPAEELERSISISSISQETPSQDSLESLQDGFDLEPDDDNASTISHLSDISGLSELSGKDWKPMAGSIIWIQKQMQNGADPRILLNELGADSDQIPQRVDDITLWKLIINMLTEPPRRHKLRNVNTIDDIVRLLKNAKNIIVLTGAGVSVSCGIPDFRSRDGIYLRLAVDFPDLPDPQAMFDINYFSQDPRPFYKFAKDIYPGNFKPSPCHRFIKLLETHQKLLRNYTQNIDTLEKVANIEKVVECHGSFATATCTKCGYRVTADAIREPILNQKIPLCEKCHSNNQHLNPDDIQKEELNNLVLSGIMKPDIVFFGEGLPDVFHEAMAEDKNNCDLLLVIGSSLKVRPVALIPSSLPPEVPQILINREPLSHCHFDVELLGDCDIIVNHICQLLGDMWQDSIYTEERLQETIQLLPIPHYSESEDLITPPKKDDDTAEQNTIIKDLSNSNWSSYSESSSCIKFSVPDEEIHSMELKSVKERHMSIDSARDSGIGENSNFTDVEKFEVPDEIADNRESEKLLESKTKRCLTERLPPNSFYLLPPSRYIFPGAEIFYDPNEKFSYFDDMSSSDSSDSESEPDGNFC